MSNQTILMLSIDNKSLTTSIDRAGYRKVGVQMLVAATLDEARETLDAKPIDVIVLNFDYPDIDPIAVCKSLRHHKKGKDLPIVLTSVQSPAAIQRKSASMKVDLIIEQPIPRSIFIEKIKSLLEIGFREKNRVEHAHLGTVDIHWNNEHGSFPISDISTSGMLIQTEHEMAAGTQIVLKFKVPHGRKHIKATGEVIRRVEVQGDNAVHGLGVRFVSFEGDGQQQLHEALHELDSQKKHLAYYL